MTKDQEFCIALTVLINKIYKDDKEYFSSSLLNAVNRCKPEVLTLSRELDVNLTINALIEHLLSAPLNLSLFIKQKVKHE